MPANSRRRARQIDIWPGFVDALATLIMVIVFVLLIFTLFQFYLKDILAGRDQALQWLNQQLGEIADMLAVERQASTDLKSELARIQDELAATLGQRDALASRLAVSDLERSKLARELSDAAAERERLQALAASATAERDQVKTNLADAAAERDRLKLVLADVTAERDKLTSGLSAANEQLKDKEVMTARLATQLTDANKTIDADKEKIEVQLRDLANLRREIETLVILRRELEAKLAEQAKQLNDSNTRLAEQAKQLGESGAALGEQKRLSEDAKLRIDLLTRQLNALRDQLAQLNAALEASEAKTSQQQVQIADLGRRLNLALASKVEELSRFRSEFFGRLRQALGNRSDIRVVGDRFVFQSEVLFLSGSAELEPGGLEQLARLATELVEVARKIPPDLNWVLQVDGHTDSRPISNLIFPSNWELSAARAISVAKFLVSRGIPASRVSAAGFAEFQPLDPGDDEIAYRRNRRIEIKLTSR